MAGRLVEEIGLKAMEYSSILMPVLLTFLRDDDSIVARQSIASGSSLFCSVLEEMVLQVSLPPPPAHPSCSPYRNLTLNSKR